MSDGSDVSDGSDGSDGSDFSDSFGLARCLGLPRLVEPALRIGASFGRAEVAIGERRRGRTLEAVAECVL